MTSDVIDEPRELDITNDTIFSGANEFKNESKLKCFVMMPFGQKGEYDKGNSESNYVFNKIICKALKKYEAQCKQSIDILREVDKKSSGNISKSIIRNIAAADICIVDITGLNPNVFFELGIRYSLRNKITILLKQESTAIPFDIMGLKCFTYECFEPDNAVKAIVDCLNSQAKDINAIDSLVFESFTNMSVRIPGIVDTNNIEQQDTNVMPWSIWQSRIEEMAALLSDSFDNGRFVPTVVLGISNGGLLVSDLLVTKVFKNIPLLSLWANRLSTTGVETDSSCPFFDNDFNRSAMSQLKRFEENGEITILLVDDIVYSSSTISQAREYLKRELGEKISLLFTPMYCKNI